MKTFKQKNYDKLIKKVRLIFAHEIVNCIINQLSESIMFRSWKFFLKCLIKTYTGMYDTIQESFMEEKIKETPLARV